jgi:Ca2+-binding RTX toxin-like protein
MFAMMSENMPGKSVIDFTPNGGIETEFNAGTADVHVFVGQGDMLIYIASTSDETTTSNIDLSSFIAGFSSVEISVLGVGRGQNAGNNDSDVVLRQLNAQDVFRNGVIQANLDRIEIMQVVIRDIQPTEEFAPTLDAVVAASVNHRHLPLVPQLIIGTNGADSFALANGEVRGLDGDDLLTASGDGLGLYNGGAGNDTVGYQLSGDGVWASLFRDLGWSGNARGDHYVDIENLIGSNHADKLWGDNTNNHLEGLHGNDTIIGAGGDDYILAGFGTDVIIYSGNRADYRVAHSGIRTEVEHLNRGVDGFDVLGHAEILRFADGDFIL